MYKNLPDDFDWGSLDYPSARDFIIGEIFNNKIYDFWVEVKENDIVIDVGSSVGPFAYKCLLKNPKKIYCIEPSKSLIQKNIKNNSRFFINKVRNPITFVNAAIADNSKNEVQVFGTLQDQNDFEVISFQDFIDDYNISKIDFLKIDCEGGEYSILNEKYLDFIRKNVKFISCEVHARGIKDGYQKFLDLKRFLSHFPRENYKIMCFMDWADYSKPNQFPNWHYQDVTNDILYNEDMMNYILNNSEVMLYIKNEI